MKKYIWLASYPKSGNTMLRLFLSAFFFTKDGKIKSFTTIKHLINFQSMILKLPKVPSHAEFLEDITKVCPLWIDAQKFHAPNIKNSLIVKTHSFMGSINGYPLTTNKFTRGFIHIVRDPRSVLISNMHHYNLTMNESMDNIMDEKRFSLGKGAPVPEILSSWNVHYRSWEKFKANVPSILVKFEDIIASPQDNFLKILKFLQKIMSFEIIEEKFNNALESVQFNKLQDLEQNLGFDEKLHGKNFFRKGLINEWKALLSNNQQKKIKKTFEKEMDELGYK